jgi:hypothetical protein
MGGTAAGPSPRAVAAGLALALLVLLVAGRLQQRVLAPQPSAPARPLAVTPTPTIPPIPVTARISIRVDDVVALATTAGEVWAPGPRELLRVDPDDNRVTARIRIPGPAAFDGGGLAAGAGALWIRAGERTVRVDARRGRVTGSVPMPVQAAASDGLWSCTAGHQRGPDRLVRMDPHADSDRPDQAPALPFGACRREGRAVGAGPQRPAAAARTGRGWAGDPDRPAGRDGQLPAR